VQGRTKGARQRGYAAGAHQRERDINDAVGEDRRALDDVVRVAPESLRALLAEHILSLVARAIRPLDALAGVEESQRFALARLRAL
jgi:hypothetical protein